MRKILLSIVIVILMLIIYIMLFEGINIFGFRILSVSQMQDENSNLDTQLNQVSILTSVTYPKALTDLTDSTKQLLIAKEEYADLLQYSSNEQIDSASQLDRYEMEYLWTKIGNHATKNGIILKFEVKTSSTGTPNQYDLHFLATGQYVSISEFVEALENDSSLSFKIENFTIRPNQENTENLQATFMVRDISINIDRLSEDSSQSIQKTQNVVDEAITGTQNEIKNDINYSNKTN